MLLEWLSREGGIVLSWWALVTLAGVAALPLCLRLLGGLPDRGYTLARAAGLLLVGFVFWLLASLGFLRNTTDSMALAWLIVLIVALAAYFAAGNERIDLQAWWRENRSVIVVGEILFFVLLLGWSIYRAYQNSLPGTEKPMELAFMSATMRSQTFPPADPWLSGYAISYYYFGYVMAAMLSMLSGVSSAVGFNMTNALLFSLTGLTAFGVVYNLVRSRAHNTDNLSGAPTRRTALLIGVLGMVFVVLLSNFELPLIEIPYETRTASTDYLQFWGLNERITPRGGTGATDLLQWDNWWWFRSARVLNDLNLDGSHVEVIDEFPQFSFLLADNHPHVLALPFAALALGLALNTLLRRRRPNRYEIIFYSVCFGGLIFLNTWDGPVYLILLLGAEALRRLMQNGTGRLTGQDWRALALLGGVLASLSVIFYLPFVVAFRSQLAGILPNLLYPTLFQQYFMHFGPLILLFVPFLIAEAWRAGKRINWSLGLQTAILLLVTLFGLLVVITILAWFIPSARSAVLSFVDANGGWGSVLPALFAKRVTHIVTTLVIAVGIVVVVARLFPRADQWDEEDRRIITYSPQTGFALLLIAAALVLTLVPEFVFLRDNFNTRMNTVFKFYYQGWLMLAVASAYGVYSFLGGQKLPSRLWRAAYSGLVAVVLVIGLMYPVMGLISRTVAETGRTSFEVTPTLDGGPTLTTADDYQASMCLGKLVTGTNAVIASAVGGSYQWAFGVASTLTGIPTVFNWPYHELQWRGTTYDQAAGSRERDIDQLYSDPTWSNTQTIIDKYGINYIVFGSSERNKYANASEVKFLDNLDTVCQSGETYVFQVPDHAVGQ